MPCLPLVGAIPLDLQLFLETLRFIAFVESNESSLGICTWFVLKIFEALGRRSFLLLRFLWTSEESEELKGFICKQKDSVTPSILVIPFYEIFLVQ